MIYAVSKMGGDEEEVRSLAHLGICEAIKNFDPRYGTSFETYAIHRIRGAILDGLRQLSTFGKTGYNQLRRLSNTYSVSDSVPSEDLRSRWTSGATPDADPTPFNDRPPEKSFTENSFTENRFTEREIQIDRLDQRDQGMTQSAPCYEEEVELQESYLLSDTVHFQTLQQLAHSIWMDLLRGQKAEESNEFEQIDHHDQLNAQRRLLSNAFSLLSKEDQSILIAIYDLRRTGDNARFYSDRTRVHRSTVSRRHHAAMRRLKDQIKSLQVG